MATFSFQARTTDGKFVKGELDSMSEQEARIKLRSQKLIPIKVLMKGGAKKKGNDLGFALFDDKVKPKDLKIFTRQFAVLVAAGVPIVQGLESLSKGTRSPALTKALILICEDVKSGKRLGEALAARPKIFDRLYVNLVKAGEEGGVLDVVLNRLAEYIEKMVKLKGKVTSALWYPAVIIVIAALVITGIMIFVIPAFAGMFAQGGKELPFLTQLVMDMSNSFATYWYLLPLVFVSVPMGFKSYYNTSEGRKVMDTLILQVPLFGTLVKKSGIARMARTLSTLLSAGVKIMDALEIAASTTGNWVIEKAVLEAREAVSKGQNLVEPLRKYPFFDNMVLQMITVGESTGNLDAMLNKIADFYEDEVEATADALTSMIEPMLMVFLGGIIAVIVIAMYLPIFDLAGSVVG